jgi:hypothetical protein
MNGKVEEARRIVEDIHSVKGDPDQSYARSEFYQMQKQIAVDRTLESGWVKSRLFPPLSNKAE